MKKRVRNLVKKCDNKIVVYAIMLLPEAISIQNAILAKNIFLLNLTQSYSFFKFADPITVAILLLSNIPFFEYTYVHTFKNFSCCFNTIKLIRFEIRVHRSELQIEELKITAQRA